QHSPSFLRVVYLAPAIVVVEWRRQGQPVFLLDLAKALISLGPRLHRRQGREHVQGYGAGREWLVDELVDRHFRGHDQGPYVWVVFTPDEQVFENDMMDLV